MKQRKISVAVSVLCLTTSLACTKENDSGKTAEPCRKLAEKICQDSGRDVASCGGLKAALDLLSARACGVALDDFSVTKRKLASQARNCDIVIEKICAAVGPDSVACTTIKARAKTFSPTQCTEMLRDIDKLVQDLMQQLASQPMGPENPPETP